MVKYEVIISPEFKKEFYKLPKLIQDRVRKILKKLETRLTGSPLKWNLKGFYSIHFNRNHYRLIYVKEDKVIKIMALHVGKRTNTFYKKFEEEIKRRGKNLIKMKKGKIFKLNQIKISMEKIADNCNMEIKKIKKERDSWKETALIAGDPGILASIDISLKQISSGQGIPLAQL